MDNTNIRTNKKEGGATMTNHAKVAEIFPEAYQGIIQMSDKEMTIIEAATFRGLPALLKRYGEWVITKNGIDSLATNYHIAKDRLDEYDWIKHMSEKTWVNIHDFERAFFMAQTMLELEII